jgi:cephalosporin hydroxylase
MNEITKFQAEVANNIQNLHDDPDVQALSRIWLREIAPYKYAYNFTWMGRPIIQFPQDMLAMQEIIWNLKPDLIIETGIAHGGSLIFHASMLELVGEDADVLGIDIDIREHNRIEIEKHPMFKRITLIEGSSVDDETTQKVFDFAKNKQRIVVILDSNHTHEHVLKELEIYSQLVTKNSYLIVFDTLVEDMPDSLSGDRPWGKGNNPKTAVWEFLKNNDRFEIDKKIESKLLITVAPDGYLKCIKD